MKLRSTIKVGLAMMFLSIVAFMGGCKKNELSEVNTPNAIKSAQTTIDDAKEMITLDAISMRYSEGARRNDTKVFLEDKSLATKGNWEMIWYSFHDMKSVLIMVVKHKYIPNTYAIISKGQKRDNVFSLYQGIYVFGHENFTWLPAGQAPLKIASGAHQLAETMFALKDDCPALGLKSATIKEMIKAMVSKWDKKSDLNIYASGQSLGGAAAVMLGTYAHGIVSTMPNIPDKKVNIKVYNYAGPNVFQKDYVDYYNGLRKDQHINVTEKAICMHRDVVSNYFPHDFNQMLKDYEYGTAFGIVVKGAVAAFNEALELSGEKYVPVGFFSDGSRVYIENKVNLKKYHAWHKMNDPLDWVHNYVYNHLPNNYVVSLDAPPVPFFNGIDPYPTYDDNGN